MPSTPAPAPEAATVQEALAALKDARDAASDKGPEPSPPPKPALFRRAIRLCAATGDAEQALGLLDAMRDDYNLEPDLGTYLAALQAMEDTKGQHLQRAWFLLHDMRKQGLDPFAPLPASDEGPPLRYDSERTRSGLQRHANAWLSGVRLPLEAFHTAICIATALREREALDAEVEKCVRAQIIDPALEALREPVDAVSQQAAVLKGIPGFGAFTADVLERLQMANPAPTHRWQEIARQDLRRQEMIRRWARWDEGAGPGLTTWLAYNLSGGEEVNAWELSSEGEAFGLDQAEETGGQPLLPPLLKDAGALHAEQGALLNLVERILAKIPPECVSGIRVKGIVLMYSLRPPSVASIYAMRQFLRLFPGVRVCVGYGYGLAADSPPENIVASTWGEKHKWSDWKTSNSWGAGDYGNNGYGSWTSSTAGAGRYNGTSHANGTSTNGASWHRQA